MSKSDRASTPDHVIELIYPSSDYDSARTGGRVTKPKISPDGKKKRQRAFRHGTTSSLVAESSFSGVGGKKQKNKTASHKELQELLATQRGKSVINGEKGG